MSKFIFSVLTSKNIKAPQLKGRIGNERLLTNEWKFIKMLDKQAERKADCMTRFVADTNELESWQLSAQANVGHKNWTVGTFCDRKLATET